MARWSLLLVIGAVVLSLLGAWRYLNPPAEAVAAPEPPRGVAALGHIEPEDGSVRLGARSLTGQSSIVGELLVKEGDAVTAGQVLAILDSKNQLEATLRQTEARVRSAEARLAQARAGTAKTADVAAQKADVARMEAELANAQSEFRRVTMLHDSGLVSHSEFDSARLLVDTRKELVDSGKERLRALEEVRPIDIEVLAAQVQEARSDVVRAQSEHEAAIIRSPIAGRVLKVFAWPGAEVGPNGIAEIAKTQKMYVIAEVAQSDISRITVGQRASSTGEGVPGRLDGTVEWIASDVARNTSNFDNPRTLSTTRIVEVKIVLDNAADAERLIHAQVEVRFALP
jgi:HlyD family secretion protein